MGWLSDFFSDPISTVGDSLGKVGNELGNAGDWLSDNVWEPVGDFGSDVGDWAGNLGQFYGSVGQDWWDKFTNNPLSLMGLDPISAKLANKVLGKEWKPYVNIYGGPTQENYQNAENRGIDTSNMAGLDSIARAATDMAVDSVTGGLGSTALHTAEAWGNDQNWKDPLKSGLKNYALNQLGTAGLDSLGVQLPATGGYQEAGGGFVGNNEFGGTGGFNLGQTLGAGEYSPYINNAAKSTLSGGLKSALQGGNSTDIGRGAQSGLLSSGLKQGIPLAGESLMDLFKKDEMPDVGTLGGTMTDNEGENSATLGGEISPTQKLASMSLPTEKPATGASQIFSDFISAMSDNIGTTVNNMGINSSNFGGIASDLLGLYSTNEQRKRLKEQRQGLSDMYGQNSPYAQMLRQRLERSDAAAGRRSQAGSREVELQARLADLNSRNAPALMNLTNSEYEARNRMLNTGLKGLMSYLSQPRLSNKWALGPNAGPQQE